MRRTAWVVLLIALALAPPSAMASSGKDDRAEEAQEQEAATSFAKMADQVAIGDTTCRKIMFGRSISSTATRPGAAGFGAL